MTYEQMKKLVDMAYTESRRENFIVLKTIDINKSLNRLRKDVLNPYLLKHGANLYITDKGDEICSFGCVVDTENETAFHLQNRFDYIFSQLDEALRDLNRAMQDDLFEEKTEQIKDILLAKES